MPDMIPTARLEEIQNKASECKPHEVLALVAEVRRSRSHIAKMHTQLFELRILVRDAADVIAGEGMVWTADDIRRKGQAI